MAAFFRLSTVAFAAGALGGLMNSLTLWAFGAAGVTHALGVALAPHLSPPWLYPRLVWGGIWGWTLLLPLWRTRPVARGVLLSLAPTAVQLFVVFPLKAHKGMMGLDLGLLTPLLVFFFNAVWGVSAALWFRSAAR